MTDLLFTLPVWLVLLVVAALTIMVCGGILTLVWLATRPPYPEVDEFTKRRMILAPRFDRPKGAA